MNRKQIFARQALALAIAAGLAGPLQAGERESLEALHETTMSLIGALVEQGILPKEKADAMVKAAREKAAASAANTAPAAAGPVRVQYVPESVKAEIREQLKQEVLAQAKNEHWAAPNAVPAWVDRIKWEGDVRVRYQMDKLDGNNTPASCSGGSTNCLQKSGYSGTGAPTRWADVFNTTPVNTTEDRERYRLRARLGLLANVSDEWSAGIRITTGNTSDRVSTNQTMGQNFNKYSLVLDRAYVRYDPTSWLSATGGRMPNPWLHTDLVWDKDLNFEGFAATLKPEFLGGRLRPFLTVGAFPLKEDSPPSARDRWLQGAQLGTNLSIGHNTNFSIGAAMYNYKNIEGYPEDSLTATYFGQSEYPSGLRQKGNTLFLVDPKQPTTIPPVWGLASRFRPVNLTASLDLAQFDPVHVILTADYVKNTAFDRSEIERRTGLALTDGKDYGYLYRVAVGMPKLERRHDWNASFTYRYLGSDATVDGFTDSDFGLGGTNLRGYILAFNYGLDPNASIGVRWYSAQQIDSFSLNPSHRYAADVLMADLNVRF